MKQGEMISCLPPKMMEGHASAQGAGKKSIWGFAGDCAGSVSD